MAGLGLGRQRCALLSRVVFPQPLLPLKDVDLKVGLPQDARQVCLGPSRIKATGSSGDSLASEFDSLLKEQLQQDFPPSRCLPGQPMLVFGCGTGDPRSPSDLELGQAAAAALGPLS